MFIIINAEFLHSPASRKSHSFASQLREGSRLEGTLAGSSALIANASEYVDILSDFAPPKARKVYSVQRNERVSLHEAWFMERQCNQIFRIRAIMKVLE